MDSARDVDGDVQAVVQPSLLSSVREPDPEWVCPQLFDLGCNFNDSWAELDSRYA